MYSLKILLKQNNLNIKSYQRNFRGVFLTVKDWYNRLLKKYITHENINNSGEFKLKMCKMEFLNLHINHENSYLNIRKTSLPSYIMSSLYKLKHDLYLTEEGKYYYGISTSNRCNNCLKVDFQGHFLLFLKFRSRLILFLILNIFSSN